MAKLLKFGVGYIPKKVFKNNKTGEKEEKSCVSLALFSDLRSGAAAFPQIQSFMRDNATLDKKDGTIFITIPEDKFEIFAKGKLLERILSTFEQTTGYVADSKDISELVQRFNIAKDEVLNSNKSDLDAITSQYLEDLISGIERDFNDPRFQQIMNSIHTFSYSSMGGGINNVQGSYNDSDVVLKETKLSVENVIRVLSQWHKAGRPGIPTYLATENQWHRYFNGTVKQDALKLYVVRPDKVNGVSTNTVTRQLGIDPNSATSGGAIGRGVNSIARGGGMDKWRGTQEAYAMTCYYDISDVDGVDPNLLTGNTANYYDPNTVTADTTDADTGDIVTQDAQQNDIVNDNQPMTEDLLRKKLLKYAADNKIDGIQLAIQRDGTIGGLVFMINHLKAVFRNRNAEEKKATAEQILFVVLKHYNIFEDEINQLYKKFISKLRTPKGKVNEKLIYDIWSFAYDIISKLDSINEEQGGSLTLMDVIGYLGFTVDEFKRMPKTEEEANMMMNGVRESFIKTFNKLLI